jgi:proteasome lid subunit RPN8/RPN11
VKINRPAFEAIQAHGSEGYPDEICGLMLGSDHVVTDVRRARNIPDHPAQASRFDTERAWAGYVYVIVSIEKGKPVDANAFVADADGGPFHSEPLEIS